jgi:hypothetical protein
MGLNLKSMTKLLKYILPLLFENVCKISWSILTKFMSCTKIKRDQIFLSLKFRIYPVYYTKHICKRIGEEQTLLNSMFCPDPDQSGTCRNHNSPKSGIGIHLPSIFCSNIKIFWLPIALQWMKMSKKEYRCFRISYSFFGCYDHGIFS